MVAPIRCLDLSGLGNAFVYVSIELTQFDSGTNFMDTDMIDQCKQHLPRKFRTIFLTNH